MARMDRREFLQRGIGMAGVLAIPARRLAAAGERPAVGTTQPGAAATRPAMPEPCSPTAWKKHGVILEATEPWEGGHIQNFTCPAEPLEGDRWRIWYSGIGSRGYNIAYAEGVPGDASAGNGRTFKKFPARCTPGRPEDVPFAVGNLPEKWNPVQVIHIRLQSGRHRIYFWAHGPRICRYLAAESDDGRRYRVLDPLRPVLYHPSDRAAHGVPSPDGFMVAKTPAADRPADEPVAPGRLISNDATTIYQLPDGSFELYSVGLVPVGKDDPAYVAHDNAAGLLRMIDHYTSEDGLHFTNRRRVIQRDARDPVDQQFYHLAVTYTDRGLVGMLGHYRVQAQTMDLEWCYSADGKSWQRPRREGWIQRGNQREPDSYGIYPPNQLVRHGGQYHLFYTAVNHAHNNKHSYGPPKTAIMHATTESIWG